MRKITILLCLLTATAFADTFHLILAGHNVGPVKYHSSRADFDHIDNLPKSQIKDDNTDKTHPTTELWGTDPEQRLLVHWFDEKRERVAFVYVGSASWKTEEGIGVGTTLRRLHGINGKAFRLNSFSGPEGGCLIDLRGGKLSQPLSRCRVTMSAKVPGYETLSPAEKQNVMDAGEFSSDSPLAIKLNPVIQSIEVFFGDI